MNTFWLKIAALAVVVVAAIVLIGKFMSSEEPQPKPKTFYDMVDRDKKFLVEPRTMEEIAEEPAEKPIEKPAEQPIKQQVREQIRGQNQVQEQNQPPAVQTPPRLAQPTVVEPNMVKPQPQPTTLYFAPLSEIDKIEAERLLNIAVSGRSLGRLPQTGFQLMVQTCRQIISKWPDSWYTYRAKQMLADMPERFRERYKITQEELDISKFTKQRPGTEPYSDTAGEESP
jgi:hypothetical protein